MIPRFKDIANITKLLERHPVVAIIGARQVGKSTLARMIADTHPKPSHFFDLENPENP